MYSWGGSASGFRGSKDYDFGSARAKYDKMAASMPSVRSYSASRAPDMKLVDPKGKVIKSDSKDPIVIAVDVTGSMASWPGEIFDRLPLLYQTLAKYRPETEISFAAIGDASCDDFPLQVSNFDNTAKGLEKNLKALGCEGGGGGHITESYELFGQFMLNNVMTPNATSPFLLIYGDETFYDEVNPKQVEYYIGSKLQSPRKSSEVWDNLLQRFNVYFLQKPYGFGDDNAVTKQVRNSWEKALGSQRVIQLPYEVKAEDGSIMSGSQRAVDVGMGLIAKHWGEYSDFTDNLDARHDDPSVKASVHKSLRFVDANPSGDSVMPTASGKDASKSKSKLTKSLGD